jgi:hypothetical protein
MKTDVLHKKVTILLGIVVALIIVFTLWFKQKPASPAQVNHDSGLLFFPLKTVGEKNWKEVILSPWRSL